MARKTKVASLKKRLKSKPFAYVDKKGNVRHFSRGKKSSILQKKVVTAAILKKRRAKGKKGILLYVKGKNVMSVPRKAKGRRKKRKKAKKRRGIRRSKKRKGRKRGRKRISARKRKSRRCPKTRAGGGFRSASACVRKGKGKTLAKKKVYNKAIRRLRKSKKGRSFLRKGKHTLAKVKGKAVKRKKRRRRRR
jgi:hypothetical protein